MNQLLYPLDGENIFRKKNKFKNNILEKEAQLKPIKVAILGGSTTHEIKKTLDLYLLNNGFETTFYESEYNKYYEDALFNEELLKNFNPDIIYIHTTNLNISSLPKLSDTEEEIDLLLKNELEKYKSIWKSLLQCNCAIIQNNFDLPINRSLGNLDCYDIHGKTNFINLLNLEFSKNAREIKNLYINDINYLSSYIGLEKWFDKSLWYQAKYAMSLDAIPELAFNISKIINSIFGKTKKCLVLDLDNTCWGGVIGDDGLDGISIGTETALSEAYTAFQKYVKRLKDRGITLAVCSKNDFQNAKEGFSHPDTILTYEDFTSFKANWDPKSHNIVQIAKEINIGIDSLVFIDDNPVEREIVSSHIAETAVPNVGSDIVDFINHIDRNGFFEPISLSQDDLNRNKYYEDNKKREEIESSFASYDEFLKSLKMEAEIEPFSLIYLDRITQLINKTNQFNLTTKRYTYGEIETIMNSESYIKLYGKLSDKFGDNGLISIAIGRIEQEICHIDLWLMSCRVLKRDMEFTMFDKFIEECSKNGIKEIIGYYYKTKKNDMVSELYKSFGFELISIDNQDTTWKLEISKYEKKNRWINVIDEK